MFHLLACIIALVFSMPVHAKDCQRANISDESKQATSVELKNPSFPLNYYEGPGYECRKILGLKSGVEELSLYGVQGEWAAVKILKPEAEPNQLLWIKKSEIKPFSDEGIDAGAIQDRRSALIPIRKGNDRKRYDYSKALITKDVRIFHRSDRPTTDFFLEGDIVSVHGKQEPGKHDDAVYFVSGWSRDNSRREVDGLVVGSALQLLEKKEYNHLYDEKYPIYERKADATKRTSLYSVPGKGRISHYIGPKNRYGGDKDLDIMRRTPDGNWFLVRYWTGELGGYRQGWAPRGTIKIHMTTEEIEAQVREAEERARLAKLEEDARLAEERAKQLEDINRRAAEEKKKQEAEAAANEFIKSYIYKPEATNVKYVARARNNPVDILTYPDPFSAVIASVPVGEEYLVNASPEAGWVVADYSGVQGFVDENHAVVDCDSAFLGYLIRVDTYSDSVVLASVLKNYQADGVDDLRVRLSSGQEDIHYVLEIGPYNSRITANNTIAYLRMKHDINGTLVKNSVKVIGSSPGFACVY